MTRDEAIKGLLDAAVYLRQEVEGCINTQFAVDVYRWTDSIMEAVKLLKAQELIIPPKIIEQPYSAMWCDCGKQLLRRKENKYCQNCGRKIIWN